MDALTALLRHIKIEKLEPLLGSATPATPAAKPLTDAPIVAADQSTATNSHADATAPNAGGANLARAASAHSARFAAEAEKQLAPTLEKGLPSAHTRISPNATLLSQVVHSAQNNSAPMPPALALNVATTLPALVAQNLNASLSQSGLFYESHLEQWVAGARSLASLHTEPHNRVGAGSLTPDALIKTPPLPTAAIAAAVQAGSEEAAALAAPAAINLPEALQPIVREQINALDFQRILWHGEVWPQQQAELEIQEEQYARQEEGEAEKGWLSTLRIELPGLGLVIARVSLNEEGARVGLRAAPETIQKLQAGGERFRGAMEAAGIALRQLDLSVAAPAENEAARDG